MLYPHRVISASERNWKTGAAPQRRGPMCGGKRDSYLMGYLPHTRDAGSVIQPPVPTPWVATINCPFLSELDVCRKCSIGYNLLPKSIIQVFLWILSYIACHELTATSRNKKTAWSLLCELMGPTTRDCDRHYGGSSSGVPEHLSASVSIRSASLISTLVAWNQW